MLPTGASRDAVLRALSVFVPAFPDDSVGAHLDDDASEDTIADLDQERLTGPPRTNPSTVDEAGETVTPVGART